MIEDAFILGLLFAFAVGLTASPSTAETSQQYLEGVWNNFNFTRPATDWSDAAKEFAAEGSLIDLVVAQENLDQFTYIPFPYPDSGYLRSSSQIDLVEPYLEQFDEADQKVILSLQPGKVDPLQLVQILLSRYGHHRCIIGLNVDLEWKKTGEANHASNEERDAWLYAIKQHDPDMKLLLTYFLDYTHFPDDVEDMIVLFDGEGDLQSAVLAKYGELARHFKSVGIYTGYPSSLPQTASKERILSVVSNTEYIIHTYDIFPANTYEALPSEKSLIFVMSDVQVDWLDSTSVDLMVMHQKKNVPVVIGVIPNNLNKSNLGGLLQDLHQNSSDLFEVAEYAYSNTSKIETIRSGYLVLSKLGLKPETLIPSLSKADDGTVKIAEELGFHSLITSSLSLDPGRLKILNTWVSMTEETGELKDPTELMAEIDGKKQDAVIVLYQVQNFEAGSGNRIEELGGMLDAFKESQKYRFMTANQYLETLPADSRNLESMKRLLGWNFHLAAAAMYAISRLFFAGKME